MMEIKPTLVNGTVVLDVHQICTNNTNACRICPEQAVGIHNWLMATGTKYVMVDFQDEKEVCQSILIELLQLRKRLKIPFVFVGLMEKARSVLTSYAYSGYPFFSAPEEAAVHLKQMHPDLVADLDFTKVQFGQTIPCSRTRNQRSLESGMDEGDFEEMADEGAF